MNKITADVEKATAKNKRYKAVLRDRQGNKIKTVSFGHPTMQNFTIHKNPERKRNYLSRHQHDPDHNPFNPSFWSTNLLWNKQTLQGSAEDIQARKKIKVNLKV